MSETRFTITLGRTGQVVERGGGSKQFSDGFFSVTKRQRVDEFKWSPGGNRFSASRGKYDLRLKLIRKRRAEELRKRHLREKQLKPVQRQGNANMFMHEHRAKGRNLLRQYPSKEVLGDLHPDNSMQKYYSFQTKDGSWAKPPGRALNSSRKPSRFRTSDGLRQVPVIRRNSQVLRNEVVHASMPTAIAMKASAQFAKPVPLIGHIMPKSPPMGVDTLTVPSLLQYLGLRKYARRFQAEEVDMDALKQMSDKDLTVLRVPMGPRKKILRALQACKKQPPS